MSYCTALDIINSVGEEALTDMLGGNYAPLSSDPSIASAVADAALRIDSYLSARYALPLPVVAESLRVVAVDIAIYYLFRLRRPGDLKDYLARYQMQVDWLEKVRTSDLDVPEMSAIADANVDAVRVIAPRQLSGMGVVLMPVITINIDTSSLQGGFERLLRLTQNLLPVMDEIGLKLAENTQERFRTNISPEGQAWKPKLVDDDRKILVGVGAHLRDSITHLPSANSVAIGTNMVYAAIHQFGSNESQAVSAHNRLADKAFGKKLKFPVWQSVKAHTRTANMPARPYLGFSADDELAVTDIIETHLEQATSASLLELEEAVLVQLDAAPSLSGIKVQAYPDRPGEYRLLNPKGAALVVIQGSRYGQAVNGVQTRTTRIIVTLLVRNLSTHAGAYPLIDGVLAALQGWTPDEWQPVAAVSEQFVTEDSGVWQYDLVFETSRLQITQYNPCGL